MAEIFLLIDNKCKKVRRQERIIFFLCLGNCWTLLCVIYEMVCLRSVVGFKRHVFFVCGKRHVNLSSDAC